jgi:hypothetical protein
VRSSQESSRRARAAPKTTSGPRQREAREDDALPGVEVDLAQTVLGPVDLVLAHARGGDQLALEGVAPRVVDAGERAALLPEVLLAQHGAAVAADVVEAAQLAVVAAHDEDRLADDVDAEPRSGLGSLVGAARDEPRAEEDLLALELVDREVVVVGPREGAALHGGGAPVLGPDAGAPASS